MSLGPRVGFGYKETRPKPDPLPFLPLTDNSNGRSDRSNGRPDGDRSGGSSGSRSSGAADQVANLTPLGISCEFSVEYGLGWVFRWVWTIFGLGFLVSFD